MSKRNNRHRVTDVMLVPLERGTISITHRRDPWTSSADFALVSGTSWAIEEKAPSRPLQDLWENAFKMRDHPHLLKFLRGKTGDNDVR